MLTDPTTLKRLYWQMQRIRLFQYAIEAEYHLDEMKTPVHLYIGQEAVAVGICDHLKQDDYISSNHRSHGHYLAKGGDLKALVAELFCRKTGCSKGRGGSMHLFDISVGHTGSSSIVGGGIPIGTGLALAAKMKNNQRVSVVFFSDGAADEGVLYESVNYAILRRLPVIYIYENNQYSVCSPVSKRQVGDLLFHRADKDLLSSEKIDGNDVNEVHLAGSAAILRARNGEGPSFIECSTYRIRGHAGVGSDLKLGYRTKEELDRWTDLCPIKRLRKEMTARHLIDDHEFKRIDEAINQEIAEAFAFAKASPLPDRTDLPLHLYAE